jgi:hypothetical protein
MCLCAAWRTFQPACICSSPMAPSYPPGSTCSTSAAETGTSSCMSGCLMFLTSTNPTSTPLASIRCVQSLQPPLNCPPAALHSAPLAEHQLTPPPPADPSTQQLGVPGLQRAHLHQLCVSHPSGPAPSACSQPQRLLPDHLCLDSRRHSRQEVRRGACNSTCSIVYSMQWAAGSRAARWTVRGSDGRCVLGHLLAVCGLRLQIMHVGAGVQDCWLTLTFWPMRVPT